MTEADREQRRRHAVIVLALQRSKRAVEAEVRAQGHKLAEYSSRDLRLLAEQYLDQHRAELMAEAKATVERWIAEGVFGKRAQRAWAETESVRKATGLRTLAPSQPRQCGENLIPTGLHFPRRCYRLLFEAIRRCWLLRKSPY
jgi:hypothetical protein